MKIFLKCERKYLLWIPQSSLVKSVRTGRIRQNSKRCYLFYFEVKLFKAELIILYGKNFFIYKNENSHLKRHIFHFIIFNTIISLLAFTKQRVEEKIIFPFLWSLFFHAVFIVLRCYQVRNFSSPCETIKKNIYIPANNTSARSETKLFPTIRKLVSYLEKFEKLSYSSVYNMCLK